MLICENIWREIFQKYFQKSAVRELESLFPPNYSPLLPLPSAGKHTMKIRLEFSVKSILCVIDYV